MPTTRTYCDSPSRRLVAPLPVSDFSCPLAKSHTNANPKTVTISGIQIATGAVCVAIVVAMVWPMSEKHPSQKESMSASLSGTETDKPLNMRPLIGGAIDQSEQDEVALGKRKKPNGAASTTSLDISDDAAKTYIAKWSPIAVAEMRKFGIPASISLAQGLVESGAGLSSLVHRNNNHFGMKCFSKRCAKGHCSNFTDDHHKDFFRIYKNSWESWRAHSEMLASGRYVSLQKHGKDYRKWAYGLKSLGYATDKTYAEKLIGMINRYDLQKFDE